MIDVKDVGEFNAYLRTCTDGQARGVLPKEKATGCDGYVALAEERPGERPWPAWGDGSKARGGAGGGEAVRAVEKVRAFIAAYGKSRFELEPARTQSQTAT